MTARKFAIGWTTQHSQRGRKRQRVPIVKHWTAAVRCVVGWGGYFRVLIRGERRTGISWSLARSVVESVGAAEDPGRHTTTRLSLPNPHTHTGSRTDGWLIGFHCPRRDILFTLDLSMGRWITRSAVRQARTSSTCFMLWAPGEDHILLNATATVEFAITVVASWW